MSDSALDGPATAAHALIGHLQLLTVPHHMGNEMVLPATPYPLLHIRYKHI